MGAASAKINAQQFLYNNKDAIKQGVKQQIESDSKALFKQAAKEEFKRQGESIKAALRPGKVKGTDRIVLNELEKYAANNDIDINSLMSNSEYLDKLLKIMR